MTVVSKLLSFYTGNANFVQFTLLDENNSLTE